MANDQLRTLLLSQDQKRAIEKTLERTRNANQHENFRRSADSQAMIDYWDKTDAIVDGYQTVKSFGELFLPRFVEETDDDYSVRLSLTKFTNIYRDVLEGLSSKPFQEEINLLGEDVPEEIEVFAENVDGRGNSLSVFAAQTFFNGINSAIDWIFVDAPAIETGRVLNRAEEQELNIRPFWSHVLARNVLEVQTSMFGAEERITYIRVLEPNQEGEDYVRIFALFDGVVIWELWQEVEGAEKPEEAAILVDSGQLTIPVIPFIPFVTGRRNGRGWQVYPPMQDAADLQVELYQEESALKFIKTMAGYPMLAANGIKPEKDGKSGAVKKVNVGPMKVLYGPPDGNGNHGEWKFIEPSAHSMEFLNKSIESTKQDLRELGRQPLTALSSQLTTVTTSVAAGKAKSAVGQWAMLLKDTLENAFKMTAMFMGVDYETEVHVYNDFDNVSDTNADIDNLLDARQNGDLSQETLWTELKRRKVLSAEFKAEDEQERLLNEVPTDGFEDDDLEIDNEQEEEPTGTQP